MSGYSGARRIAPEHLQIPAGPRALDQTRAPQFMLSTPPRADLEQQTPDERGPDVARQVHLPAGHDARDPR